MRIHKTTQSFLVIILLFSITFSCNTKKNVNYKVLSDIENTDMITDTFDFDLFEKNMKLYSRLSNVKTANIVNENGEKEKQSISTEEIVVFYTPPLPKFYWIYKEYYLDGKLK